MGRKLEAGLLQTVLLDLSLQKPLKWIARNRGVGRNTVRRIELSLDLYGSPYAPDSTVQGRPRLMVKAQEKV
jgi:hypothetical protein